MPRIIVKAETASVIAALKEFDADESRSLTKWQKDLLRPVRDDWKAIISSRTGQLKGSTWVGQDRGAAWVGYGAKAPVYAGVQEFGGSVPAPYSKHAAKRLGKLASHGKRGLTVKNPRQRRILIKPKAPAESYWLYPTFRRHEPKLVDDLETHVAELKAKHGL